MELQKRKQIRLKSYNYSQNGYYFITICTKDKEHTLCDPKGTLKEDNSFVLSEIGNSVNLSVENIHTIYDGVTVDYYEIVQYIQMNPLKWQNDKYYSNYKWMAD